MITERIETKQAVESLMGTTCPACAGRKGVKKSLCYSCFYALPPAMKVALYQPVGRGYEQAITEALSFLTSERTS